VPEERSWTRITADNGTFRFSGIAPGDYVVSVELPGYAVAVHEIRITAGTEVRMAIRLSPQAILLEPLVAVTTRRPQFMQGFEARRAQATRHSGFFTHDEIQDLHARYITEVLWTIPGIVVPPLQLSGGSFAVPMQSGLTPSAMNGGRCMTLFVNGTQVEGAVPYDEIFPPEDVAALEVYGLQHDVPAQFQRPGGCGALVVWLRERSFASVWKRLFAGLGVAGVLLLLTQ
ncbi:MAG: carboxypeptidase regulatory-like domain-containing protein, partial [Gemmatimonadota bacterium]